MRFHGNGNGHNVKGRRGIHNVLQILQQTQDPLLRWHDVPGGNLLAEMLINDPEDHELSELYDLTVSQQVAQAVSMGDPFWGSFPPLGSLPPLARGRVPLVALQTGDVLSIDVKDVMCNVIVCGPTGQGKTSWLRLAILSLLDANA